MHRILLVIAALIALVLPARADWPDSLEAARVRAQREGKPIFLLSMFGRLDEQWC